jgi:ubiquinone/menaquinone biosynthesis C-methylase UbiE
MTLETEKLNLDTVKARSKATWEAGDFGQVAKHIVPVAEEFMQQLPLRPGMRVLDAACGTGNLAVIAARAGCITEGVDIASNLIQQARERARHEGLSIQFIEGDAENLPYLDESFDAVVSMFGVMFAPRPEVAAAELWRVLRPGGFAALANWTPTGFVGKMFAVVNAHLPPPPATVPSPLLWGDETTVRSRLKAFAEVRAARRIATMRYPFPPAETVEFFKRYFGPTVRAFAALSPAAQPAFQRDLVALQTANNSAKSPDTTEASAEYLHIIAAK